VRVLAKSTVTVGFPVAAATGALVGVIVGLVVGAGDATGGVVALPLGAALGFGVVAALVAGAAAPAATLGAGDEPEPPPHAVSAAMKMIVHARILLLHRHLAVRASLRREALTLAGGRRSS
jgi:hypothetical protein